MSGQVVVRPIVKIMVTLDHRVMDGYKGGQLSAELKRIEDPEKVLGLAETMPVKLGAEAETAVEPVSGTESEGY